VTREEELIEALRPFAEFGECLNKSRRIFDATAAEPLLSLTDVMRAREILTDLATCREESDIEASVLLIAHAVWDAGAFFVVSTAI